MSDKKELFQSIGEIRRASDEYRSNQQNPVAIETINQYRRFRLNCVQTSLALLRQASLPDRVFVCARLKRLSSIYRKLKRNERLEIKSSVNEMDDIIGFRIICQSYSDAMQLGKRMGDIGARIKDYLQDTHFTGIGYRSIHAVIRFQQPFWERHVTSRFEVQIRTWYQHRWACWCERFGERAKEGFPCATSKEQEIRRGLLELSHQLKMWEETHPHIEQHTLLQVSDLYNVAVAWYSDDGSLGYDPCMSDMALASSLLSYLETQESIDSLLLIGIVDQQNLRELLRNTHPKFMTREALDPHYWMPTQE